EFPHARRPSANALRGRSPRADCPPLWLRGCRAGAGCLATQRALRQAGAGTLMARSQALARAGEILWDAWQQRAVIDTLPPECRPQTRGEGYLVQSAIEARSPGPLFGWKVAATSVAGQRHIQVSGPIAGRLLRERAHPSGSRLSLAGNRMAVAEPEFAFRMGRDLVPKPQPYSLDEVMAAVAD